MGEIISKFVVEPIHKQKEVIGEIADALIFYAKVYSNPGTLPKENANEAMKKLRQLATLLQSRTHLIPAYGFFAKIGLVVKATAIGGASKKLIGLSNSLYGGVGDSGVRNSDRADQIRGLLDIPIIE